MYLLLFARMAEVERIAQLLENIQRAYRHIRSLGMQLIKLFAEQLEGDLYFINRNGLEIILSFRASNYARNIAKQNVASSA